MTKFIQCEQCHMKMTGDKCEFAVYARIIDSKEYTFCCAKCAEQYEKKKRE